MQAVKAADSSLQQGMVAEGGQKLLWIVFPRQGPQARARPAREDNWDEMHHDMINQKAADFIAFFC